MQSLEFRAMNTEVLLAAKGEDEAAVGLQVVQMFIEESERRFSRFVLDSELSRLNNRAGEWVQISDDLMHLLRQSQTYYEETEGLFDPSVLPDLKRAGYDQSLDVVRAKGEPPAMYAHRIARPPFSNMELDVAQERVRLPVGMEIDLGGIAKGWIVQKAASLLSCYATACAVSAGGDIFFVGLPEDGSKWRVEIEDPRDENQTVAVVHVEPGAVVTSSIRKRTWNQNGQARHHVIDPRTGEPAETDWLSVTVIAPRTDMAEAYAKALLIGGEREAIRLTQRHPQIAFVSVDPQGKISGSPNSKEYFNDSGHIHFQQ